MKHTYIILLISITAQGGEGYLPLHLRWKNTACSVLPKPATKFVVAVMLFNSTNAYRNSKFILFFLGICFGL